MILGTTPQEQGERGGLLPHLLKLRRRCSRLGDAGDSCCGGVGVSSPVALPVIDALPGASVTPAGGDAGTVAERRRGTGATGSGTMGSGTMVSDDAPDGAAAGCGALDDGRGVGGVSVPACAQGRVSARRQRGGERLAPNDGRRLASRKEPPPQGVAKEVRLSSVPSSASPSRSNCAPSRRRSAVHALERRAASGAGEGLTCMRERVRAVAAVCAGG